jgi:biopolymer transport protein ExbD
MSIRFQCPSCRAIHGVNERAVGRRVRCPDCQELVEVVPFAGDSARQGGGKHDDVEELEIVELEELPPEDSPADLDALVVLPPDELRPLARHYLTPPPITAAQVQAPAASPAVQPPSAASEQLSAAGAVTKRKPLFRRRKLPEAEMDMTPMVDVTFQLLIFFMLTASFTMQKSLSVPKPQSNQAAAGGQALEDFERDPEYVVVRVDGFNTFHISSALWDEELEAPSEQELLVKLRQARQGDGAGNRPRRMLVVASGEALHDRVVTAIDAGNEVGMDEVQLVTVESDE